MIMRFAFVAGVLAMALANGAAAGAAQPLPAKIRRVVLDPAENGFRWKLVEAPMPTPGPRQVLLHVRAVSLNRGDIEMLAADGGGHAGQIVATDAAGEIVAIGSDVKTLRAGERVTSLYFQVAPTKSSSARRRLAQTTASTIASRPSGPLACSISRAVMAPTTCACARLSSSAGYTLSSTGCSDCRTIRQRWNT
jgi:NADPH:quinone reductase-like Zn-dependent oxidoreductase